MRFSPIKALCVARLDEFMTVAEAAEYLGVAANTVRNWGRDAKIPEHRHPINNYRLYKKADLDRVLKKLQSPVNLKNKKPKRG